MFRMIVDLFNAGTDTTATGLSWAILHLIRNPAVQDKCRAEIMQVKPYFSPYYVPSFKTNTTQLNSKCTDDLPKCGISSVFVFLLY